MLPTDSVAKAHGLLRMFRLIASAVVAPPSLASTNWTVDKDYYYLFDLEYELNSSMLIEIEGVQMNSADFDTPKPS